MEKVCRKYIYRETGQASLQCEYFRENFHVYKGSAIPVLYNIT